MCLLGTFSQRSVVSASTRALKMNDDLPLETVALVGCGVPTGWGTAVNAGGDQPGDAVIYGIGGVGINAVQGAVRRRAPRDRGRPGGVQAGDTPGVRRDARRGRRWTAQELVTELTRGAGADQALVTVGVVTEHVRRRSPRSASAGRS